LTAVHDLPTVMHSLLTAIHNLPTVMHSLPTAIHNLSTPMHNLPTVMHSLPTTINDLLSDAQRLSPVGIYLQPLTCLIKLYDYFVICIRIRAVLQLKLHLTVRIETLLRALEIAFSHKAFRGCILNP